MPRQSESCRSKGMIVNPQSAGLEGERDNHGRFVKDSAAAREAGRMGGVKSSTNTATQILRGMVYSLLETAFTKQDVVAALDNLAGESRGDAWNGHWKAASGREPWATDFRPEGRAGEWQFNGRKKEAAPPRLDLAGLCAAERPQRKRLGEGCLGLFHR